MKYDCIVIDPPWNQGKTGKRKCRPNQDTKLSYKTMTKEEILNFPINDFAKDNCFLWLWTTNSKDRTTKEPFLKTSFDFQIPSTIDDEAIIDEIKEAFHNANVGEAK